MMRRWSSQTRQRCKLLALIALFAGPLVVAWVMVEWRIGIPDERVAHGRLMPSLPPLAQWPLQAPRPALAADDWIMAYECSDGECTAAADRWWRLHRALGREASRVTRLRLGAEDALLPGEVAGQWTTRPEWVRDGALWVIDPAGRVVLGYHAGQEADGILEDIKHLLRVNPQLELASRE